jgi:hypothetical protein
VRAGEDTIGRLKVKGVEFVTVGKMADISRIGNCVDIEVNLESLEGGEGIIEGGIGGSRWGKEVCRGGRSAEGKCTG